MLVGEGVQLVPIQEHFQCGRLLILMDLTVRCIVLSVSRRWYGQHRQPDTSVIDAFLHSASCVATDAPYCYR